MAFSKIILNGTTLMDVTNDTVATDNLLTGYTATGADGLPVVGSATGGNDFIVTLTWDDDYFEEGVGAWVPDHTLLEIRTAYSAGKNIITTNENAIDALSDGVYIYDEIGGEPADYYIYAITWYDDELGITYSQSGHLDSESLDIGEPYIISPNLESREVTYIPSNQAQENWLYPEPPYNGFSAVGVTVNAVPNADWDGGVTGEFITQNNQRKWKNTASISVFTGGYLSAGTKTIDTQTYNAVPSGTTITPTTSAQTIGGNNYMMEGAVTVSAVQSGTAGTPTATKGTVSNHSVTVTPSVTNTTGYITGSTINGTAVTVSASELVSGTYSVTSSGTKDVTNYASASVPSGTVTAPAAISGTSATVSTGTNTLTLSKTVSVTPSVSTAGYISSGTAGNASVSLTASVTTKAAATITPGTTNQTIASGTYLTGTQTIAGDADLVASNIVNGVQIFGVTGNVVLQNYYTGSSAPSSSLGSNGDLYLQS